MSPTTWMTVGVFTLMGTGYLAGMQAQVERTTTPPPPMESHRLSVAVTTTAPTATLPPEEPQQARLSDSIAGASRWNPYQRPIATESTQSASSSTSDDINNDAEELDPDLPEENDESSTDEKDKGLGAIIWTLLGVVLSFMLGRIKSVTATAPGFIFQK